jgi:hypothetical protein
VSIDVLSAAEPWMQVCGPHDYGVDSAPCGCPPDGDPRVIVSKLAAEVQRLRDADGLARDALRRSGYLDVETSDRPLADLIDKLNADARDAVRVCGEESKRLRDRLAELGGAS